MASPLETDQVAHQQMRMERVAPARTSPAPMVELVPMVQLQVVASELLLLQVRAPLEQVNANAVHVHRGGS